MILYNNTLLRVTVPSTFNPQIAFSSSKVSERVIIQMPYLLVQPHSVGVHYFTRNVRSMYKFQCGYVSRRGYTGFLIKTEGTLQKCSVWLLNRASRLQTREKTQIVETCYEVQNLQRRSKCIGRK